MFDPEELERNQLAQQGLKFLWASQIIPREKAATLQRLASGDPDEKDETILEEIRRFRRTFGMLESLEQQCEQYSQEGEDK